MTMLDLLRNERQRSVFDTFDAFSRDFENIFQDFERPVSGARAIDGSLPACDVTESEKDYLLEFDVPGLTQDDLSIEVIGNQVIVSGERRRDQEAKDVKLHRQERRYGAFQRVFTLTEDIDSDHVSATYEGGVLALRIPKSEAAKPKKIPIGGAKAASVPTLASEPSEKAS